MGILERIWDEIQRRGGHGDRPVRGRPAAASGALGAGLRPAGGAVARAGRSPGVSAAR